MAIPGLHFDAQPPLSDIIRHFYVIQTDASYETTVGHLSPNYEMMLLFNFGAPMRYSFAADPLDDLTAERIAVIGPLKKMLNYEVLKNTDLLVIVFNLDGFYRLYQQEFAPDETLWAVLKKLTNEKRVQVLSDYILSTIHPSEQASEALLNGADYFNDPAIQPVKAIADDADLSERTVQTRFKKYVGYSPKEMLRFLRFKQVINTIEHHTGNEIDWFDLIHNFGYHDQSHLIKDFHHFLGITPQQFIKQFAGKEFCTTKPGKNY